MDHMAMTELEWAERFANKLERLLEEWDMTQKELAEETNIAESTISRCLSGKYIPTIRTIVNIGYALGCDVEELIDFHDRFY